MIKYSKLVLGHTSGSLDLAVLWGKPILLLTSTDLQNLYAGPWILGWAKALELRMIDMDDGSWDLSQSVFESLSKNLYKEFSESYIKLPHSKDESMWSIFAKYVKNMD